MKKDLKHMEQSLDMENLNNIVSNSDIAVNLGATEVYDDDRKQVGYHFDAPETVQEAIMTTLTEEIGEKQALEWFKKVDEFTNSYKKDEKTKEIRYFIEVESDIFDPVYDIEKRWLDSHEDALTGKKAVFRQYLEEIIGNKELTDAFPEKLFNDGFMLNLDSAPILGYRWLNGRDIDIQEDWENVLIRVETLRVAINAYIFVRLYGEISIFFNQMQVVQLDQPQKTADSENVGDTPKLDENESNDIIDSAKADTAKQETKE